MEIVDEIKSQIDALNKGLTENYVTKSAINKLEMQLATVEKSLTLQKQMAEPHPVFGNMARAAEAVEFMTNISFKDAISRKPTLAGAMSKDLKEMITKASPPDMSNWVNQAGGYTVQTSIYPILEQLFLQSGLARRHGNWTQVAGKLQVSSATDQATSTFTPTAPTDIGTINETTLPLTANTLAPAPLTSIFYLGRQLLANTAVNLTARVMENIAKANSLAEDITAIWGDGSTTYGDNYGFTNVSGVVKNITGAPGSSNAGKLLIPLSQTPAAGDALPTLDDLIALTTSVQEEAALDDDCAFFMNRQVAAYFRSLKASTSGLYFLDPVVNPVNTPLGRPAFMFMGYPVYIWNRMSTGQLSTGAVALTSDSNGYHWTTTSMTGSAVYPIVAFGSLKKAALFGTNREFAIESSVDYKFAQDMIAYKGREDYGVAWPLPQALACLCVTAQAS